MPACSICGKNYTLQYEIRTLAKFDDFEAFIRLYLADHHPEYQLLHASGAYGHAVDGKDHILITAGIDMEAVEKQVDEYDASVPHEKLIADFMVKMNAFESGQSDLCPHCGRKVASLQKIGRCVYARPCDCRLWQGGIPEAWRDRR